MHNTYKFSNHDINEFILLFQKGVWPIWICRWLEKIKEATLSVKEDFNNHLNMEDITDADYTHAKRVYKDFDIKNLGKYYGLYVQSDTLLLADVFENFRNMCWNI